MVQISNGQNSGNIINTTNIKTPSSSLNPATIQREAREAADLARIAKQQAESEAANVMTPSKTAINATSNASAAATNANNSIKYALSKPTTENISIAQDSTTKAMQDAIKAEKATAETEKAAKIAAQKAQIAAQTALDAAKKAAQALSLSPHNSSLKAKAEEALKNAQLAQQNADTATNKANSATEAEKAAKKVLATSQTLILAMQNFKTALDKAKSRPCKETQSLLQKAVNNLTQAQKTNMQAISDSKQTAANVNADKKTTTSSSTVSASDVLDFLANNSAYKL